MSEHLPQCSLNNGYNCCDCYPERITQLEAEIGMLREGLMQIRTMRLQMPLANCIPVIDALRADTQE